MCAESLTFTFIQTQRPLLTPNSTTATRRRRGVNGSKSRTSGRRASLRFSAKGGPVILVHATARLKKGSGDTVPGPLQTLRIPISGQREAPIFNGHSGRSIPLSYGMRSPRKVAIVTIDRSDTRSESSPPDQPISEAQFQKEW